MIPGLCSSPRSFRHLLLAGGACAGLLLVVPGAASAGPVRLSGGGTGGIAHDDGLPLLPLLAIRFGVEIEEADVAPTGAPPGFFRWSMRGRLDLSSDAGTFASSPVDLQLDLFFDPPAPGMPLTYTGSLYAQEFDEPALLAAIPNVALPSILESFELKFTRANFGGVLPIDSSPEGLFLALVAGIGIPAPDEFAISGRFNPTFSFSATLDSYEASAVPEPAVSLLAAFGLALAFARAARRGR